MINLRAKDLQVQTLVNLGSLWQEIADAKKVHGVGPGGASAANRSARSGHSLKKVVAREANKLRRGFARMATMVDRTEAII